MQMPAQRFQALEELLEAFLIGTSALPAALKFGAAGAVRDHHHPRLAELT